MKASSQAVIDHPADRIDLADWLATLSDQDYQNCSRGHRAAGTFREAGTLGMVNVESIGGHLLVQHYLAASFTPRRVVMRSNDTRVYILHAFPAKIEVIWTLEIEPKDDRTALFRVHGRNADAETAGPRGHLGILAGIPAPAHARRDRRLCPRHYSKGQQHQLGTPSDAG